MKFLEDIVSKLQATGRQELDIFTDMKKADYAKRNIPFDGKLYTYDYQYYCRQWSEAKSNIDGNVVKEYFPVATVVPNILSIYENLLGIRIEEVKGDLWAPGIQF